MDISSQKFPKCSCSFSVQDAPKNGGIFKKRFQVSGYIILPYHPKNRLQFLLHPLVPQLAQRFWGLQIQELAHTYYLGILDLYIGDWGRKGLQPENRKEEVGGCYWGDEFGWICGSPMVSPVLIGISVLGLKCNCLWQFMVVMYGSCLLFCLSAWREEIYKFEDMYEDFKYWHVQVMLPPIRES